MVENIAGATKAFEDPADDKHDVGRVPRVNDAETGAPIGLQSKIELRRKRQRILHQIARGTRGFPKTVPVNLDALDDFIALFTARTLYGNHGDTISRVAQSARFLHGAAHEREGKILNDDQNTGGPIFRHDVVALLLAVETGTGCRHAVNGRQELVPPCEWLKWIAFSGASGRSDRLGRLARQFAPWKAAAR